MRTFFMLLGELAEAVILHFKDDPEFHLLVINLCESVLKALGMPVDLNGDGSPSAGTTTPPPTAAPSAPGLVDFSARRV